MSGDHLRCTELVEAITDYLAGALRPAALDRIEVHLAECPDCHAALEQFRRTIELAGVLPEAHVEALGQATRERLMTAFCASHP